MGCHLDRYGLSYFPVPKCACSSLKAFFFELENGRPFQNYRANGKVIHIHHVYRTLPFETTRHRAGANDWKIAVVRDPVARLLSCYSNRVLHHRELDGIDLSIRDRIAGLVRRPDIGTFVDLLPRYRELSPSMHHHSAPHVEFLGLDPAYFDRVYRIDQLDTLVADVAGRVGTAPALQRLQMGGPKLKEDELSWQKPNSNVTSRM
jgi:hypothetical protein